MAYVFLSYATKDAHLAERIETALAAHGHHIWRDVNAVHAGKLIPEEISLGLRDCDYLAVIITRNSERNDWVLKEVCDFMMKRDFRNILPLRFEHFPPEGVSSILNANKWADFSISFEEGLRDILQRLGTPSRAESHRLEDFARRDFAIDLALRAGSVAMRFYNSCLEENRSIDDRKNAATEADVAANLELKGAILSHPRYKRDGLISESLSEDTVPFEEELAKEYTWIVDPLDGTTNFQNRIPIFCTAVGVLHQRQPYLGVIYDPVANEVYYALEGEPARVWRVSRGEVMDIRTADIRTEIRTADDDSPLLQCLAATHLSSRPEVVERMFDNTFLLQVAKGVRNIRALGSGQLALAYVAANRIQLFFQLDSHLWDQVAGVVLVRNAGGVVSDLRTKNEWVSTTKDILATSHPLFSTAFLTEFQLT